MIPQLALAAEPTDISNHWAQDYILNLVNNEVMELYSDGTFKPDKPITRGEFAVALAKQMNLLPDNNTHLSDLNGYPDYNLINALVKEEIITGYPDGTFKPNKPITRAEMVAIIIKSLGINDNKVMIDLANHYTFKDVPANHWALNHIKIAEKLELVSGDRENNFHPGQETTRAEAAKCLTRLALLSSGTGYITDVYPTSRKVSINLLDGKREVFNFNDNTLVARNNRNVELSEILKTDKVFIITDNNGNLKYVKAYGMITQEDLATEISAMTNGVLNTEEVKMLSSGNLEFLKPKLQTAIRNQLAEQGLTPAEVTAIMSTNWNQLEELSKERLAEAIAIQTSLPLDITRSLISGDWEKIKTYAQIELIQRLVQEVLNSDILS
jgi:hypothetical protein